MFSITLICMGKLKERFIPRPRRNTPSACGPIAISSSSSCRSAVCRSTRTTRRSRRGLQKEAELIRAKLPKGCFFCVLTPEGKLLSSEQLADTLRQAKSGGRSSACFLIGSSFGIAPELKKLADLQLSMSKMTFPHHLARVMALEQLYRAEAIQAGSKYHK